MRDPSCGRWRSRRGAVCGQWTVAALSVLLVVLSCASQAWGNAAAPIDTCRNCGTEAGAFVVRPTALVVEHEDLEFRCDAHECVFIATYRVLNPGDVRVEALGAFYGIKTDRFAATVNGVDVRHPLTAEQVRAIDDAVATSHAEIAFLVFFHREIIHEGFAIGVDAHARATLVFGGRMDAILVGSADIPPDGGLQPLWTRHPWLGRHAEGETVREYAYALSPIRSWGGSPNIDVAVRCPSASFWANGQHEWTVGNDDGGFVARRTIAARDASLLRFKVVDAPARTTVLHGGPLVGVGGRLDAKEFRARVGYEAAFPWWLVASASIESNFKDMASIIPVLEYASPNYAVILPSIGLGAGVPIQLRAGPGARAGARMQLTASFPMLSVVLPVDVFPGQSSSDTWQVGLFGQASF